MEVVKMILLDREFKQLGHLKWDLVDEPIVTEDQSGEHTLRFRYPLEQHERYIHSLRIHAGKTLDEVGGEEE